MSEYMPVSPRAKRLHEGGADIEDVRALDAMEMAAAQAQVYEKNPAARDPQFQERVNRELAARPGEYAAVAQSAGTLAGYELAIGRVLSQGEPSGPEAGARGYGGRGGDESLASRRARMDDLRQLAKERGLQYAVRAAGGFDGPIHPDLDVDPRR